jgi:hypothetical protein
MKSRILPYLLYIYSFSWLVFAILWFIRVSEYRYFYSILGALYALIVAVSAYFIRKKKRWAWWVATILVGVSIIAGICDQVGSTDIIFIAAATFLFIYLIKERKFTKNS